MNLRIEPKSGAAGQAAGEDLDPRARMRAARQRLAKGKSRLFVLPGYDTDNPELGGAQVVCRYNRLGYEDLKRIFVEERGDKTVVEVNAQFLAEACDEILWRDKDGTRPLVEGAKTEFLHNIESGESFATFTGVEDEPTLAAQMVAAFGENDLVLNDHSGEVHAWMVAANAADGEIALGEL